ALPAGAAIRAPWGLALPADDGQLDDRGRRAMAGSSLRSDAGKAAESRDSACRRDDAAGAARAGAIGSNAIVHVGVPNRTRRTADRALRLSAHTFGRTSEGLLVGLQRLPSRRRLRRLR